MPELSADNKYWRRTSRCPRCQRFSWFVKTYKQNGEILRGINPKDPTGLAECPHCHGRWFNFEQPARVRFIELERSYEVVRHDTMILNNSGGTSALVRRCTINEEWSQQYDLEREATSTESLKAAVGSEKAATLGMTAEQSLKERYAISERVARTYTDELTFDVPAGVLRTITFTYKRAVQHGRVLVEGDDVPRVEVPYRVVVDLLLDVTQEDEVPAKVAGGS